MGLSVIQLITSGKLYYNDFTATDDTTKAGTGVWTLSAAGSVLGFNTSGINTDFATVIVSAADNVVEAKILQLSTTAPGAGTATTAGITNRFVNGSNNIHTIFANNAQGVLANTDLMRVTVNGVITLLQSAAYNNSNAIYYDVKLVSIGNNFSSTIFDTTLTQTSKLLNATTTSTNNSTTVGIRITTVSGIVEKYLVDWLSCYKNEIVSMQGLMTSSFIELLTAQSAVVTNFASVNTGNASLDISNLSNRPPYYGFAIWNNGGKTRPPLYETQLSTSENQNIFGGDVYRFYPPQRATIPSTPSGGFF